MDEILCWFNKTENIMGMVGTAVSTLLGAALAFWFGIKLYRHQKWNDNLGYLHYVISTLVATVNHLYCFKKQMVMDRYAEALKIAEQLKKPQPDANGVFNFKIEQMSLYMHEPGNPWPVSHERLDFLTNREPNLIVILGATSSSVETLNSMIRGINQTIEKCMAGGLRMEDVVYLTENTRLLKEQVDSTIYLVEKCGELLVKYGQLEFGKKMKVKSFDLDKSYESLKPKPISSWETTDWFSKRKS